MRLFSLILVLPNLAYASEQKPLFEQAAAWFGKAKSYIPSTPPVPKDTVAPVVVAKAVEKVNVNSWKRRLAPQPDGPQDLMVMVTALKNESCWFGCDSVNLAWNVRSLPTPLPVSMFDLTRLTTSRFRNRFHSYPFSHLDFASAF